jgi:hypothetical protein
MTSSWLHNGMERQIVGEDEATCSYRNGWQCPRY